MKKRRFPAGPFAVPLLALLLIACERAGEDPAGDVEATGTAVEVVDEAGAAGGLSYAVDADGTRAVFGRGRDVVVVDVTDPADPREVHAVTLPGVVRDLRLGSRFVYAAADTAGLQIIDVEKAAVVGTFPFEDRAYGVDVAGELAFVAARSQGLRILDVSDPTSLNETGRLITADEAVDVVVRGDYAYVGAWYESLRVIDVSDPSAPVDVSFAPYDSYSNGAVWSVAVDGELGLAAIPEKGLRIADLSDPREVTNHAMYRELRAPAAAALHGYTAYVADQDAGLRVLDLSDPAEPVEVGSLDLPGRILSIRAVDGTAYVAANEAGLRLIDVSTTNRPREIGFVDTGDDIVDVVSSAGTILAAGAENGIYHYDGDGRLERRLDVRARRVALDGGRVLTGGPDGAKVFEEGRLLAEAPGEIYGMALRDDLMATAGPFGVEFVGLGQSGVATEAGLVAPDARGEVGRLFRSSPAAWDVLLTDSLAYAAFDDGIYVIGLSNPRNPTVSAHLETPERAYRLQLAGGRLFAACDDGLRIVDVTDGVHPAEIAHVRTPTFATALLVDEGTAYVGDLNGTITAVRARDGSPIDSWKVADRVYALARTETGIAVAAGLQGLRVVSLPLGDTPDS